MVCDSFSTLASGCINILKDEFTSLQGKTWTKACNPGCYIIADVSLITPGQSPHINSIEDYPYIGKFASRLQIRRMIKRKPFRI